MREWFKINGQNLLVAAIIGTCIGALAAYAQNYAACRAQDGIYLRTLIGYVCLRTMP